MAENVESLKSEVKRLKSSLAELRKGGAAAKAKKRKKKPVTEQRVLRSAKKELRRASGRLQVEKARAARAKSKKSESSETPAPA